MFGKILDNKNLVIIGGTTSLGLSVANSIVIHILTKGKSYDRAQKLNEIIVKSGAYEIFVKECEFEENFSILNNIIPFNYIAFYLAQKLNITETFVIGEKVTEVNLKIGLP